MKSLRIVPAILFVFVPFLLKAQESIIVLDSNHSGATHDKVARYAIFLKPGFQFSDTTNYSFWAHIDPNLPQPPVTAVDCVDPATVPTGIDQSLPVGTIPGFADVSATGAANYTIPIGVPPAAQGMQPNLSIVYNSQAGNGIMGMGWNLAGLSAIARVPKNIYNDGKVEEIKLDRTDQYAFDGNRLIRVSGSAHSYDGAVYHTEIETFVQVTAKGTSGNGPQWFEVKTKDGLTMEFGRTEDSRMMDGSSNVISWKINKIYDQFSNYMIFEYRTDDDEQPISTIKYTGNTTGGKEPYNAIHFSYATRNDVNTTWPAGKEITSDLLLESIEVISQGAFAGKYTFSYQCSLFSFLTTVTQTGSGGEELNQTVCDYGFGTKSFNKETKYHSDLYTNPYYFYYGDFNGDGKTDFVAVPVKSSYTTSDKWRLYCANETGTDFEFITEGNLPNGFQTYYTGDFNGDGMDDLLMAYKYENSWYYQVSFSNGEGFSSIGHGPAKIFDFENEIFVSDFDGDGIDDYMVKRNVKLSGEKDWYIYSFGYNNNLQTLIQLKSSGNIDSWGDNVYERYGVYGLNSEYAIDFNGNGKKELLILDQTGYKVYEFGLTASLILNGSTPNSWDGIYLGDYNGDGKTDMVFEDMSEQNFRMYYSTGNEFVERTTNIGSVIGKGIYQGDYNGDGKTDILTLLIEDNKIKFSIAYAVSDGNFDFELMETGYNYNKDIYDNFIQPYLAPVQLNGDSYTDLIIPFCRYEKSNQFIVYPVNPGFNNRLLTGITDGFQNTTEFHYSPVTDNSVYTKGTSAEFPLYDYQGTSYVVNEMIIPNGAGGTISLAHTYEEAKVHRQGKGFLGFTKNTVVNNTTGKKVETTRNLNETFYFLFVSATKVFINDNLQDSISNIPGINDFGDQRFFSYISESREFDKLHGITTVSTATYDDYGNPLTVNVDYNGDAGTQTTNTYTGFGTWWCPKSRLQQSTVTKTRTGESNFTAATRFDYNTQGALTSRKSFYTQPKEVTENFTNFDNFGNPQTVTVSANGLDSRQTLLEYDGYGRFVTKNTNPLGHETAFTCDNKTGNLLTQTDANGLMTRYDYDGFGRLEKITRPDGNTTAITRDWAVSGNQLYYAKEVTGGQPEKRVYFDALGRTLKTGVAGFDGVLVYTQNQYDSKGRLWKTSEPYTGTATQFTEYEYYTDNRLKKVTYPTGVTDTYSYTPNSTEKQVSSSNGMWKTTQTDGSGALIMAEDAGGQIDYTYYAHGGVKNISYGGNSISMTYDAYGRQETLSDPDAGTVNYTWNAFGELTNQTDARNNSYDMFYDKLGRITEKKLGTTTVADYTYDTAPGKGIGQPASAEGDNNITYSYEYDNLGRPVKKTENIQGRSFTIETGYNGYSQVSQVKYPGTAAYTVDNLYQNGYISTVKGTYTTTDDIFTTTGYNQRGQVTGYTLGNGLSTTRGYDDFGFPTTIQTPGIQNLAYQFDTQTGNLNRREDVAKTLQEDFTYDNLVKNRLETWQVNSATPDTVNYYANGNIDKKSGLGNFTYDPYHPHGINGIDNTDNLVSETEQAIAYTPFNKVDTITEGDYKLEITYGPDNARKITRLYDSGVLLKTKYYVGGIYEEEIDESMISRPATGINYINGGDGLAAVFKQTDAGGRLFYIHKDHLGSFQAISNSSGTLVEELSFGPWGRRRNPADWTFNSVPGNYTFDRGYTGHEHLDEFNLINMNGRVYDPILGRFLSPDNNIQLPDYTQSLNRYSYAYNNPLVYTDPDGENPFLIALGIYAAYTYLRSAHENRDPETGKWAWNLVDWFDKGSTFIAGVNTNTEFSEVTGYVGAGSGPYIPAFSFNNNYGPGFGYWSPQGTSFAYPKTNHNRAEEVVNQEISEVRQAYGDIWNTINNEDYIQVYGEISFSIGPQLGAKLSTGIPFLAGFLQGPSMEVKWKPYVRYSEITGWSAGVEKVKNNINYKKGYSYPFNSYEKSSTYGIYEHPGFSKSITEIQKGVVLNKSTDGVENGFFRLHWGPYIRPLIFGVGIDVGIEGPYDDY